MSSNIEVEVRNDGVLAPREEVPKEEFAVNIAIGEKYTSGGRTVLVTGKRWDLLAGSNKAKIILETTETDG